MIMTQTLSCKRLIIIQKKFQISIVLRLIEHGSVIVLAVMLFIAFSPYNIILGIVWTISRIGEGFAQFIYEKNY